MSCRKRLLSEQNEHSTALIKLSYDDNEDYRKRVKIGNYRTIRKLHEASFWIFLVRSLTFFSLPPLSALLHLNYFSLSIQ